MRSHDWSVVVGKCVECGADVAYADVREHQCPQAPSEDIGNAETAVGQASSMSELLTISDLRVARRKLRPGDTRPLTVAEFADIATAEGYVKLDDPQVVAEWTMTYEVDEDDLRAQGYVKLDGIDAEALREALSVPHRPIEPGSALTYRVDHVTDFIDGVARQVLAALDPQEDR